MYTYTATRHNMLYSYYLLDPTNLLRNNLYKDNGVKELQRSYGNMSNDRSMVSFKELSNKHARVG